MKIIYNKYYRDAAMWNKAKSHTQEISESELASIESFIKALGFKKTDHGTYWKRTAYDEAEEYIIN